MPISPPLVLSDSGGRAAALEGGCDPRTVRWTWPAQCAAADAAAVRLRGAWRGAASGPMRQRGGPPCPETRGSSDQSFRVGSLRGCSQPVAGVSTPVEHGPSAACRAAPGLIPGAVCPSLRRARQCAVCSRHCVSIQRRTCINHDGFLNQLQLTALPPHDGKRINFFGAERIR